MKKNTQPPPSRAVVTKVCEGGEVGDKARNRHSDCAEATRWILRVRFLQFVPGCSGVPGACQAGDATSTPLSCVLQEATALCTKGLLGAPTYNPHPSQAARSPSRGGEALLARLCDFTDSETVQKNHAFSLTFAVPQASIRPPAGGSGERIYLVAHLPSSQEHEGDQQCVAVRAACRADLRAVCSARLLVPAGGQRSRGHPDVSRPRPGAAFRQRPSGAF